MDETILKLLQKNCDGLGYLSIFVDHSGSRSPKSMTKTVQFVEPALKCFDTIRVYLHSLQIIMYRQFCKDKFEIPYFISGKYDEHTRIPATGGTSHDSVFNIIEYERQLIRHSIIITDGYSNIEQIYSKYNLEGVNVVILIEDSGVTLDVEGIRQHII